MADIPLRTYIEQVDNLVEKKQIDEAIAHCKHILTYYPKHLGTYQALGKALLEKGRHTDAADIFNRVLSAIPDDYVSHIGMSIVSEDQGNVEDALWHMERAFEVMPSNPAIQDELRRLYGRRDGLMPPRTRLTRGALARMYVKGGLFAQAEAELKKALADNPDRLDLATVLAQVYWQTNRRQEAADICTGLVEKLPYNQEANRMLADVLLAQGRTAELVPYRQRLEALDPYAAFVDPNTDGHGPAPKPETVLIPKLDYTPDMAASASGTPEWMTSIGATLEQPQRAQAPSTPDWLPKTAPTEDEVARTADLPDWLQGAQVAVGSGPTQIPIDAAPLPSSEGDMPDWMKSAVTTPLEMPDWMKAPIATDETPAAAEEKADWATETVGEIPDWMKDMAPPGEAAALASQPTASAFAMPTAPAEPTAPTAPSAPASPEAMSEDEALRWLEGLALQQGAKPEEMVTQPPALATTLAAPAAGEPTDWLKAAEPAPAEELPDWLKPPAAPAEAVAAPMIEEVPDWLKAAEPASAEELPDWMKAPAAEAAITAAPAEDLPPWMQTPTAEATPAEELPDWLKQPAQPVEPTAPTAPSAPATPEAMSEDEALRWLEGLALQQGAKPEEMVTQPPALAATLAAPAAGEPTDWLKAAEPAPAEELPDWLKPPAAPAEAAAAPMIEEVPDWLKAAEPASAEELPDWMKAPAAEAAITAAAAEDLPPWMETQPPAPDAAPMTAAGTMAPLAADLPDLPISAEVASPAEELPDWMKEQPPAAAEAEAAPLAAAKLPDWLPAEKPDWLKQMEAETDVYGASPAPAAAEPAPALPATEAEKPDWLKQMEAEADAYEASLAPAAAAPQPAKAKLRTDELPDFLQLASTAAVERAEQPTHLADELEQEPAVEPEEPPLAAAEIPEWLKGFGPAVAESEAETVSQPAEPIQWLDSAPPPPTVAPAESAAPAEPTADIPEWVTRPAEATEGTPLADLPSWVQEPPPGPSDTVNLWLAEKKIPEWLRKQDEEAVEQPPLEWLRAPVAPQVEAPETPAAPSAPAAPSKGTEELVPKSFGSTGAPAEEIPAAIEAIAAPASMEVSEDDALRWLENLAQQQEAEPEELITSPEERLGQPPTVAAETQAALTAEARAEPAPEVPAAPPQPPAETLRPPRSIEEQVTKPLDQLPSWLTLDMAKTAPTELKVAASAPVIEAPAAGTSVAPSEADTIGEDDAMRWLESLAAAQGAPPEELITKPEDRLTQPPAWVAAETQAATAAETQAATAAETQAATAAETQAAATDEGQAAATAEAQAAAAAPTEAIAPPSTTPGAGKEPVILPPDQLQAWPVAATLEPAAEPLAASVPAEPATISEDEALRWLESLAVKQGAHPEELVTKPEERLAEPPAWVAAEAAAAVTAEPPAVPAPAEPAEPATMSEDEALRWLESLAVKQGAHPEELVTKPEERLAEPPAWVAAETLAASAAETLAASAAETLAASAAETLAATAAEARAAAAAEARAAAPIETPAALEVPIEPVAQAPAPAEAAAMSDDEALRWLESLAVKQGARPEELVTKPEDRLAEPPAWVAAETLAAAAAETQPAKVERPAAVPTVAAATAREPEPQQPRPALEAAPTEAVSAEPAKDTRVSKLAEKLAASRRAKDADVEARFEAQRAEQEATRRAVQQKMERKTPAPEAVPEKVTRVAAPTAVPVPPVGPAVAEPVAAAAQPKPKPASRAARAPAAKPKAPAVPKAKRVRLSQSPYAAEAPETVLALARQHLAEGNHGLAAESLAYLVASNQQLQNTISELEAYTAREYSAPLLQVLGDAYMKTNQLQKALETYRQALGHL